MSHIFGLEHSIGGMFGQLIGRAPSPPIAPAIMPGFVPTQSNFTQPGGGNTIVSVGPTGVATICKPKRRRRRRRLATVSDIKDLAALSSVLGKGKAFDTWIASRGR